MKIREIISLHKKTFILLFLAVLFVVIRLPGVDLPYHQDEFKAAMALAGGSTEAGNFFSHPPLTAISLRLGNTFFGNENLRLLPLVFSVLSLFLFFAIIRKRSDIKSAMWSSFLFALCFYSILASLMIDIDGAILPLFFLLSLYFYDAWKTATGDRKRLWLFIFLISLLLGFLVKLSFILVLGVFLIDFLLENRGRIGKKEIARGTIFLIGFLGIFGIVIASTHFFYPEFQLKQMFLHALYFFHLSDRNYTQVVVQGVKAIFYLSPLLIVPLLFISKETFKNTRIFFIYILLGFIFYFILFDFSRGALDKYLMFSILPLSAIIGGIFADSFKTQGQISGRRLFVYVIIGISISIILFALQFIEHSVPSLYPKDAWFSKVLHFEWNILNPFNGGSGPMGFYVSFLFIALAFIASSIVGIVGFLKNEWRAGAIVVVALVGITYNAVLGEELFYGKINGNATEVMLHAVSFIEGAKAIPGVLTYNDIGAYELSKIKKYIGRFYATPELEVAHKKRFVELTKNEVGYFLVVDIPRINEQSFYEKFFLSCETIFSEESGKIEAIVYSCKKQ